MGDIVAFDQSSETADDPSEASDGEMVGSCEIYATVLGTIDHH